MTPPVLATVAQVKDYLRIQTTAEDALLADLIARAIAEIEVATGKCLTSETVTWYDDAVTFRLGSGALTNLLLQYTPIDPASVVVKDKDGTTVDVSNYTVRQDRGLLCTNNAGVITTGFAFDNGPYTITCTAGLATDPLFTTRWLPRLTALIVDWVGYLYWQRTTGASSEKSASSTVTYELDPTWGLPHRLVRGVCGIRGPVFAR